MEKRQAVLETWLRNNPQGTNRKGPGGPGEGLAKEMALLNGQQLVDSQWSS